MRHRFLRWRIRRHLRRGQILRAQRLILRTLGEFRG